VRAFAQLISCDIHPVNNLRVLKRLETQFNADETAKNEWMHHWTHAAFPTLESIVAQDLTEQGEARSGGESEATGALPPQKKYCFGELPTLADICLVPQWYNAERFGVDLSAYPQLARIVAHCRTLDAFASAAPENQPDAIS
jgi:maleylpyruvate isomerase